MKNKLHILSYITIYFAISFTSCGTSDNFIVDASKVGSPKIEKGVQIGVYLDKSLGMKGYVDPIDKNDRIFIDQLRDFASDINTQYKSQVRYFTMGSNNKIDTISYREFYDLPNNSLNFDGKNSFLDSLLTRVIKKANDNSLDIIISDCILDISGRPGIKNSESRAKIKADLKETIEGKNISIVILQYLCNFNGNYYYNSVNQQKFIGLNMVNRPFYYILVGSGKCINSILMDKKNGIPLGYENIEMINVPEFQVPIKLINIGEGSVMINKDETEFEIRNPEDKHPAVVYLAFDANLLPAPYNSSKLLRKNFRQESYISNWEFKLLDKQAFLNEVDAKVRNGSADWKNVQNTYINKDNFAFIKIIIKKEMPDKTKELNFNLFWNCDSVSWLKSNIDEDSALQKEQLKEIEHRTYSLNTIIGGLRSVDPHNDTLLHFSISYDKKVKK